jgi:hypothetical protein
MFIHSDKVSEKKYNRTMMAIHGYGFYKSSGDNSTFKDILFPLLSVDNFQSCPDLKKLHAHITTNEIYSSFIKNMRETYVLSTASSPDAVFQRDSVLDMRLLNASLRHCGKIYDSHNFPKANKQVIEPKDHRAEINKELYLQFLAEVMHGYKDPLKSKIILQCINIINKTKSFDVMQQVLKLALAAILQSRNIQLTNRTDLGKRVQALLNDDNI